MKMKIFVVCVVTGLLVLACGCIEEEKEEVKLETALVTIQVTDKIAENFSYVNVTFSEVKIHKHLEDDEDG